MLLDHDIPVQLRRLLEGHSTTTARGMKWNRLENGDLLAAAEAAGFEVMVTGDRNIFYQQNNLKRTISLVVLSATKRNLVLSHPDAISEAVARARPGSYELVPIPPHVVGIRAVE